MISSTVRYFKSVQESEAWRFIVWVSIGSIIALALGLVALSHFGFDSWTVFELSRTSGERFFETNTSRVYAINSAYSAAFAPLWPLLMAVFSLFSENIYGGYVASFVCYAGFAIATEKLGRRAFGFRGIGLLSAILLLRFEGIRSELGAGRSIPLFLLEAALLGCLFFRMENASARRTFAIGLLTGAMVMTRFDAIPSALVVLLGVPFLKLRMNRYPLLLLGCFLAILPWVVYSWAHFHVLFATDSRFVALAVDPNSYVLDYHMSAPTTLLDAPVSWLAKLAKHLPSFGGSLIEAILNSIFAPIVIGLAIYFGRDPDTHSVRRPPEYRFRGVLLISLVCTAPLLGYIITGYGDHRYFTGTVWILEFVCLGYIARSNARQWPTVAFCLAALGGLASLGVLRHSLTTNPFAVVRRELDRRDIDVLVQCLDQSGGEKADPILFREARQIDPIKFGALTGWRVLTLPSNWTTLDRANRMSFLRTYRPEFIIGQPEKDEDYLLTGLTPIQCPVTVNRIGMNKF